MVGSFLEFLIVELIATTATFLHARDHLVRSLTLLLFFDEYTCSIDIDRTFQHREVLECCVEYSLSSEMYVLPILIKRDSTARFRVLWLLLFLLLSLSGGIRSADIDQTGQHCEVLGLAN